MLYCTAQCMARYDHIQSYSMLCALNTIDFFRVPYDKAQFQKVDVMVYLFILIAVILYPKSHTKSRYLLCEMIIQPENTLC